MTKEEFIILGKKYKQDTGFMSLKHMMVNTYSFKELVCAGEEILPWIVELFENGEYSMAWVAVLETITNEKPIQPKVENGMAFWNVKETCKAWVDWYKEKIK